MYVLGLMILVLSVIKEKGLKLQYKLTQASGTRQFKLKIKHTASQTFLYHVLYSHLVISAELNL